MIKVAGNQKRFIVTFVPTLKAIWGKHQDPVFEFIEHLMSNYNQVVAQFQEAATKLAPKLDQPESGRNTTGSMTQANEQKLSGMIDVSSEPLGAEIYVDGVFSGSTPSKLSLSIGEHTVRVIRPEFTPWERRVVVDSQSSKTLNAILEKAVTHILLSELSHDATKSLARAAVVGGRWDSQTGAMTACENLFPVDSKHELFRADSVAVLGFRIKVSK